MANSTSIIGKVVALQGQAIVKSPDGKQHQLKVGDVVYEKDVIVTMPGAHVELAFDSGHTYAIRQNETVSLDASVYAPSQVEVANAALLPPDTSAQNIANAVVGENSLDKLLEETAAGLTGGDVGEGNSFVRLDRIAESVTPASNDAAPLISSTPSNFVNQAPPADATVEVTSVSSASATEGGALNFVVQLSAPSNQVTQLNLALSSGSATVGVDTNSQLVSFDGGQTFVAFANGAVTVPAGVSSVLVRVNVVTDGLLEGNENLSLSASTSANTSLVTGTGSVIDAAVPNISISGPAEVNEAAGVVSLTITLSSASQASISVNYATANGSAIAGSDFTPLVGNVVFAPGETSKTISIPITTDRVFEGLENFNVSLSNPTNALIGTGSATVGIRDQAPEVSNISNPVVIEGGALVFDVSLSGSSTTPVQVTVNLASGSATLGVDTSGQEYSVDGGVTWSPLGGTVTVPPGSTGFQVRVGTVVDGLVEGSETISLSASTSQNNTPLVGTGTINDGDVTTVNISGPSDVNEAIGTITYTISLSAPSQLPVTVSYSSRDGSALAGSDYSAISGTVTFAPGETTKTVTVSITNDAIYEGAENFSLNLSGVVNASIGSGTVVTTIHDDGTGTGGTDDDRIIVTNISNPTVTEGGDLVFTVNLSGAGVVSTPVSVNAVSGSATLGLDTGNQEFSVDNGLTWNPLTGSVLVPAGSNSFQVRIATLVDGIIEGTETMGLSAATAQNSGPVTGIGTILDGTVATLSVSGPANVNENAGTVTYTVTLSAASIAPVTVNYGTVNGTAIAGSDYSVTGGSLTFAPGETSKTVTVAITNDSITESLESFQFVISGANNAVLGTSSVNTNIIDDDAPSVLGVEPGAPGVADNNVVEGANLVYTVTLSQATTSATTYAYSLGGGTATAGSDYNATPTFSNGVTLVGGNLIVPAGVASFTVTVATIDDAVVDSASPETLPLVIAGVTGAGGILDNDQPTITTVEPGGPGVGDDNVVEGNNLVYTVSLSGTTTVAGTYAYSLGGGSATAGADYNATPTFSNGVTLVGGNLIVPAGVASF
ncbi:retention module-containing protein, partial [Undibacterium danionis]